MKVWTTQDIDDLPEGSCIHVNKQDNVFYYGNHSSMGGSYSVKVEKKYCIDKNPLSYLDELVKKIKKK